MRALPGVEDTLTRRVIAAHRAAMLAALTALVAASSCVGDEGDDDGPLYEDDSWDFGDDDDSAAPGDDDELVDEGDGALVAVVSPEDASEGVGPWKGVWAEFDRRFDGAELQVMDSAGRLIPGRTMRVSAVRHLFVADEPMTPGALHTATVSWAHGEESWSFEASGPAEEASGADLLGRTFSWELASGAASAPPGAELFLFAFPLRVLTQVTGQTNDALDLMGALADINEELPTQDLCSPTFEPGGGQPVAWLDPQINAGPSAFRQPFDLSIISAGTVQFPFRDTWMSGTVVVDGEGTHSIQDGRFTTWVDARDVGIQDGCETLSSVGLSCSPCPAEPSSESCLFFWLDGLSAELVPDMELQERLQEDIVVDDSCL